MLLNVTYPDYKVKSTIEKIVGQPYSLIERIKMGGIGTSKLLMVEATEEIHKLLTVTSDTTYCHLECRKAGLLIGFQTTMKIYVWLIPYHKLTIYNNSGQLVIYGPKNNIKVKAPFNGTIDKKFIKKILSIKAEYLQKFNFYP
jgi:hypothetical protein